MSADSIPMMRLIKAPIATVILVSIWFVLTSISFCWNQLIITQSTEKSFQAKGVGGKRLVEILLNWTTQHEQIYVPISEHTPENPYLNTDHKIITRDDGKVFTQISVGRMLEQLNESFFDPSFSLSLISLKPMDPDNLVKDWQKQILENKIGPNRDFQKIIGNKFHYFSSFVANDSCFSCHQKSQLEPNNTLGGLVISYDISEILEQEKPLHRQNLFIHVAIFLLMTSISLLSLKGIRRLVKQLEFEKANRDLIIEDRTRVLKEEIQQHKEARNALQRFATHDPLTGIRNRRHLLEALKNELKRYQRYKSDFSLLLIDLDHFRQINDKYGNECGDIVLKAFAESVKETLRESDTFARYDGEEFAIIATNTKLDSALRFAEKLVKHVSEQTVNYKGYDIALSVSIGVTAPSVLPKLSSEQLLTSADDVLNIAKAQGRNCAVRAQ
ncbi:diguanylate cyclase [Psychrobium sp. MM17-31]|uniref:diguanylate cyclase n=1 Tax=Psychrobium sp. MM17-31 TaxID=2917758 RepID=UPI001EF6796C|nr:diguanylate cyclase [Psychrobium sp. MM17-31]